MTLKQVLAAILAALRGSPRPAPVPPPPAPTPLPPPSPPSPAPVDVPAELLAAHNDRRLEAGLPALGSSVSLQMAAQSHADSMARVGKMAHAGIGDGDLASRLAGVGYRFRAAGENVARGQRDVAAVMSSWFSSPGHRANILGNFAGAGFAMARGADGSRYWCATFGTPAIASPGAYAGQMPYTIGTPEATGDWSTAASSVTIAAD
jgi:uncharacterized protein YkwD